MITISAWWESTVSRDVIVENWSIILTIFFSLMSLTRKKLIVFEVTSKICASCEILWLNTTSTMIWCVRSVNKKWSDSRLETTSSISWMLQENIEWIELHDDRSNCENDRKANSSVAFDIADVAFCAAHNFCLLTISFNLFIVSIEELTENRSYEKSLSKRTSSIDRTRDRTT